MSKSKISFAIDRGGTFTDVYACSDNGQISVLKLLSQDPSNYEDAPREGIRRLLEQMTGNNYPLSEPLDTSRIRWIRMGTTVATNALLERKGEKIAVAITKGFKDLLYIGNQARPKLFDLEVKYPAVLYEDVIEVEERLVLKQESCETENSMVQHVKGITGEEVEIWKALNKEKLTEDLKRVLEKGIKSLAVILIHSYIYPNHEIEVGELAESLGFTHVSISSHVMPMVKAVPRGFTACADAYLTPCIKKYIKSFVSGFQNDLKDVNVLFMQSDGGLTPTDNFLGSRAILSGPAGGVVGYAKTTYERETNLPVIGFDMGGTSTDVSRYDGELEHIFESTTSGVTIQAPQLDINTVAAGGGSKLFFRSGLFVVGPESAGAHPGPVCYRKGGPLTVTDANLCLGRLLPEYFPKIFGETEDQPLDKDRCLKEFEKMRQNVNKFHSNEDNKERSVEEIAMGFIKVANEAMCRPIRSLTQGKGYDTSKHVLACFGGAGGQHACAIARSLGMSTVFIHRYAGILSAFGMALADVVHEAQEPCALIYERGSFAIIEEKIKTLENKCIAELKKQGFTNDDIETESFLHMRYEKTDCALMCSSKGFPATKTSCQNGDFLQAFLNRYKREFGFTVDNRNILIDDIRVRGTGKTNIKLDNPIENCSGPPEVEKLTKCFFENGYEDTSIYLLAKLKAGHVIEGPAIIIDDLCTVLVEPNCIANVTKNGDIKIEIASSKHISISSHLDSIQLSIFSHRFMSIAEQMGRILQRTAISTNIKERLDFSCALFGPDGGLVSNAPHIPVHLGAMQEAVQFQLRYLGDDLHEGDVLLSNHPCAGGSHLPDLTVITPVFYPGQLKPVFFVASRGHHADIGGITPGSMPPHSTSLLQEGATFVSFKIVKRGVFQEAELIELLNAPEKLPGSSGTRNLSDNLSDLRAQIAANHKGIFLVSELINYYGLNVVQAYMGYIQTNAEVSVRDMLKEIANQVSETSQNVQLVAEDCMDDGTIIKLNITINKEQGSAVFDFTGTGIEVYNNWNTPKAVTLSAIIYCLRCMVGHEVPLNQGCLVPIKIILPKGIILNPSDESAVVGGNVLTSQRVVDVILKAFQVCAASQGCMNNITFGDDNIGYYETIGGGAGAGPYWHGRSGTHTHMTNTRITDPEILERRYPVVLNKFHLRKGSGGDGRFKGGDGIVREMLFRKSLVLSILTERRVFSPYGLKGGKDGLKGLNLFTYKNGRRVNLGGKTSIVVNPGDVFHLESPGGGGYGEPVQDEPPKTESNQELPLFENRGSIFEYQKAQESV